MSSLMSEILEEMLPFYILIIVAACLPAVIRIFQMMNAKSDDEKSEEIIEAVVLSKTMENSDGLANILGCNNPIEWITFEKKDGSRVRLRNVRVNEILLTEGDEGILVYRGNTIYQFTKQ